MSESEYTMPNGKSARLVPDNPAYAVTRDGEVWSRMRSRWGIGTAWKPLSLFMRSGYPVVSIGGYNLQYVHRLVLQAFVGDCPQGHLCRHLNGDETDNRVENLAWGTPSENSMDRVIHGTDDRGEKHSRAVLTEKSVIRMRNRVRDGESIIEVARGAGVCYEAVKDAVRGKTWGHVAGAVIASKKEDDRAERVHEQSLGDPEERSR